MEKYLTVNQVAEIFSVTPYTVRLWLKEKQLAGFKVNGNWRISESAVKDYAQKNYGESNATQ